MSNNQKSSFGTAATMDSRGRPASRQVRPRFRVVRGRIYSPHEQAVLDAGYPWVRTNPLKPTHATPGKDLRSDPIPDRLNWHGHHGINTHLIVDGDLTILKLRKMFNQDHVSAITISNRVGDRKELSVVPDEMYAGTSQQACRFVEGHRSLSPASARRYMIRGSVEWVDKTGKAVRGEDRDYILEQLDSVVFQTKFDFNAMRRVATCTFKDDNQITRGMSQWFAREWNDPSVQAAKGDLRAAIHPSDTNNWRKDQEKRVSFDAKAKNDSADVDMDDDEEDISEGLIRAFNEWLPGRLEEI